MARSNEHTEQRGSGSSGSGTSQSGATPARDTERAIPMSGEASSRSARGEDRSRPGERGRASGTGMARVGSGLPLSPWALMRQLVDSDLQRLLGVSSTPGAAAAGGAAAAPGTWVPDVEVIRRANDVLVRVDLPGMRAEDVQVTVEDGVLTISGEREQEQREDQGGVVRTERLYGRFFRSIPLPETADVDHVDAQLRDGVLEVTVPVAQREQGRRITVKS